ncbi:hypothetical protein CGLO_18064 [Colletotrichum gloeosporioides Cg-14]|uniref:Uncharacterized protein n=1 Tax=Colletotrichum gloeosporioides (strain Cg-14) TaxID=1237896 RepID=T0JIQ5_COLGC|nr:hypothetical protein CGLO_18064 [Colletotrichum gloeosporioides Cg-14]
MLGIFQGLVFVVIIGFFVMIPIAFIVAFDFTILFIHLLSLVQRL